MAKEITQGLIFGFLAVVLVAFLGTQVGFGCSHYEPSGVGEKGAAAEGEAAPAEGEAAPAEGEAAPAEGEAAPAE